MEADPSLSTIIGNALAVVVLGGKTLFDVWLNRRITLRHEAELRDRGDGDAVRKATKGFTDRRTTSTIVTFGLLAVSYLIFLLGALYGW